MLYKPQLVSPNRKTTASPIIVRKTSVFQTQHQNTYFTSIRTNTPIKNNLEQKFEQTTEQCRQHQLTPDSKMFNHDVELQKVRYELQQRDIQINNLNKAIELQNEDRNRLRYQLEIKTIQCVNKEREIAQLLATIHQLEFKRSDQNAIKEYQLQIEQMKAYIKQMNEQMQSSQKLQSKLIDKGSIEYQNLIAELEALQSYVRDLLKQNQEIQTKYQEQNLEFQKIKIQIEGVEILQRQLRGKEEEIQILKSELQSGNQILHTSTFDQQNNEIQNFLQQIKQQYIADTDRQIESDCASMDQMEVADNVQFQRDEYQVHFQPDEQEPIQQMYSFQSNKAEYE